MGRMTSGPHQSTKRAPELSTVTVEVRMPSERLWALLAAPSLTAEEIVELDRLFAEREAECERMGL